MDEFLVKKKIRMGLIFLVLGDFYSNSRILV